MKFKYLIIFFLLLFFSSCSDYSGDLALALTSWFPTEDNNTIYYNGTALYNGFELCNTDTCSGGGGNISFNLTANYIPIATNTTQLSDSSLSSSGTQLTTTENFKTSGTLYVNKMKITGNSNSDTHFDSSPIGGFAGAMLFTVPNFFSTVAFKVPGGTSQMGMTPGYGGGALTTSGTQTMGFAVASGGFGVGYQTSFFGNSSLFPISFSLSSLPTLGKPNGINAANFWGGLYLSDDSPISIGASMDWTIKTLDGTNLYFNHTNNNLSNTTNLVNFEGYVKAKGYLTNTEVWNESLGNSQDYYKDSSELLTNGKPNDELFPITDRILVDETIQNGTKLEWEWVYTCNGVDFRDIEKYNFYKNISEFNCSKRYESYEVPNYIQVKKWAVSESKILAKHSDTIHGYTQNFRTYTNLTDFDLGIMAENIYTQSKVIDENTDYISKFKDKDKLKVKEEHPSYVNNILGSGFDGLDVEDRIVNVEGALNMLAVELCTINSNKYSWCVGKIK